MCYRFPRDKTALDIDRQFLWGSALLIAPILEEVIIYMRCHFLKMSKIYIAFVICCTLQSREIG